MKLVNDWKKAYTWVSVRCMVLAGALQGAWATVPDDLKSDVPHGLVTAITIALLLLGIAGRLVDQTPKTPS